ncbi:helicase RepA family protein [Ruminococcus difficilis]|uniref:AAA family ATPase n=1 Tax=Ruminococcus difficilis TaxID=2763069 RepID=A0A934TY76_9FIRM|nr:helicase RepA family protein [Ruminococcus difficilis]MBK6087296.1 AAA family ATPase [Ruminococcus difficilis]
MSCKNEMTAHNTPVGAGDEQSSTKYLDTSIADDLSDFNSLDLNCFDENYLHTVSMTELYDTVYENRPPIVDGLLYSGLYLFVGSPKIGKSFLMAQLAYHISTGTPIWNYKVNKGTVLYLALEDDYSRLQKRLYQMFGTDSADNLYLSVSASQLNDGLDKQLESFITKHADTKLIIIDTLQKVREVSSDYSYSNDYEIISRLKRFADNNKICMILVHHTRKQKSDDSFDMISGTNGLLGAADGAFVLQKEKRTANAATLEISGRDQQDQKLYLNRNPDNLIWELDRTETELWKEPPEPLLQVISQKFSESSPAWQGSPTELVSWLGVDMKPNALSLKLNINAARLFNEYGIRYSNRHTHSGRVITLHREQQANASSA